MGSVLFFHGGDRLSREIAMRRPVLAILTGAALAAVSTIAFAQNSKINDANNPAPNYSPAATGQTPQTSTKIIDGNNPAPNYGGNASAAPAPKARHATSKSTSGQHATHHKHRTPAT
jgi:hypothetical protein